MKRNETKQANNSGLLPLRRADDFVLILPTTFDSFVVLITNSNIMTLKRFIQADDVHTTNGETNFDRSAEWRHNDCASHLNRIKVTVHTQWYDRTRFRMSIASRFFVRLPRTAFEMPKSLLWTKPFRWLIFCGCVWLTTRPNRMSFNRNFTRSTHNELFLFYTLNDRFVYFKTQNINEMEMTQKSKHKKKQIKYIKHELVCLWIHDETWNSFWYFNILYLKI